MEEINLLPWRLILRKQQQRYFFYWLLCILLLGVLTCIILNCVIKQCILKEETEISLYENKLDQLMLKTHEITTLIQQKNVLVQTIQLMDQLEKNHAELVSLLTPIKSLSNIDFEEIAYANADFLIKGLASPFVLKKWFTLLSEQSQFKNSYFKKLEREADSENLKFSLYIPTNSKFLSYSKSNDVN